MRVVGRVWARTDGTINPTMPTGEIEVLGKQLEILNKSATPPFQLDEHTAVGEDVRLRYRYVDLRRPEMQERLRLRSNITTFVRNHLDNNGFLDRIKMDIDGDGVFEKRVSLKELNISDECEIIDASKMDYTAYRTLHKRMSNQIWSNAEIALKVAEDKGLNTSWYAFMKSPKSENQKYNYGYWLQFYVYMDLIDHAKRKKDNKLINEIDKAYFGGNWNALID